MQEGGESDSRILLDRYPDVPAGVCHSTVRGPHFGDTIPFWGYFIISIVRQKKSRKGVFLGSFFFAFFFDIFLRAGSRGVGA